MGALIGSGIASYFVYHFVSGEIQRRVFEENSQAAVPGAESRDSQRQKTEIPFVLLSCRNEIEKFCVHVDLDQEKLKACLFKHVDESGERCRKRLEFLRSRKP
ncbi:MAG: cysteine rich repeat-containing protein [Pseudobdellovibrionaceae bacterium]